MKFKALSLIQIGATALSLLMGLCLAWRGYGYWAIVAINVLTPVFTTVALWAVCDWRPQFSFAATEMSSILKFGMGVTGFDLVNYFARNTDNILIGRFVGSIALGLYSKAYQLLMLPINQLRNPLNAVALPALSSLQNDKEQFARYFNRYVFALAFFSMPLVMFLGIFSEQIIIIILGESWRGASGLFKTLAIPAFTQAVAGAQGLVLISTGKVKRYFRIGLINSAFIVLSFFIGVRWGAQGVAVAYAIATYLVFFPSVHYCFKDSPVTTAQFFREISLPFLFSCISGGVMLLAKSTCSHLPAFAVCVVGFFAAFVSYAAAWCVHPASRKKLNQVLELLRAVRNKK